MSTNKTSQSQYKELDLGSAHAVGVVKISTTCQNALLRQVYSLTDCSLLDCQENAQASFFGSCQGANVAVSSVPCNSSGCFGTLCNRVTTATATSATADFYVDCRGIVGQYVYVELPDCTNEDCATSRSTANFNFDAYGASLSELQVRREEKQHTSYVTCLEISI